MTNNRTATLTDRVVVLTHAELDAGYRTAQALMLAGHRLVVTSRHPAELTRILHGVGSDQVLAVAADTSDPHQLCSVVERGRNRFGRVDTIIDASALPANPPRRPACTPGSDQRVTDSRECTSAPVREVTRRPTAPGCR